MKSPLFVFYIGLFVFCAFKPIASNKNHVRREVGKSGYDSLPVASFRIIFGLKDVAAYYYNLFGKYYIGGTFWKL